MLWMILGTALMATLAAPDDAIAESHREHVITVEGQAEVRAKPDHVHILLVAEQRAASLPVAEAAVRAATDRILAVAREHSVAEADIDYSDYTLRPLYEWSEGKRLPKRLGFQVRRSVGVALRDLSRFGSLLSQLTEIGAVSVSSVGADIERTRAQRDEARLLAIRAAREKAQAIVSELGQSLGSATVIEVDGASAEPPCCGSGNSPWSRASSFTSNNIVVEETGGPTYALGEIALTARVKVVFELK